MIIIGLVGNQGSGKDTVADYLTQNYDFIKISFASPLKDIVSIVFDWDRELLEGTTIESRKWREEVDDYWKITPREALQKVGTDLFRNNLDKDIWVKSLRKKIQNLPKNSRVVVTDCRFLNEVEIVKSLNGTIIKIDRKLENITKHESENLNMINEKIIDYILDNNKDINSLYKKIEDIINILNN